MNPITFNHFPKEILNFIFQLLPPKDYFRCKRVCKLVKEVLTSFNQTCYFEKTVKERYTNFDTRLQYQIAIDWEKHCVQCAKIEYAIDIRKTNSTKTQSFHSSKMLLDDLLTQKLEKQRSESYLDENQKKSIFHSLKELECNPIDIPLEEIQYYLGIFHLLALGEQNRKQAFHYLKLAADHNYAVAQYVVGQFFLKGIEVPKNQQKALVYFKNSMEQGYHLAQYAFGEIYRDCVDAITYYCLSAKQGFAPAQYEFANRLKQQNRDRLIANQQYEFAANQGHPEAQAMLGQIRFEEENYPAAFKYLHLSVQQGCNRGAFLLLKCYQEGKGTEKDEIQAFNLLCEMAKLHPDDLGFTTELGFYYYIGMGTQQDFNLAFNHFKKAAHKGCASAQHWLSLCYAKGQGTEVNFRLATFFSHSAAKGGFVSAQNQLFKIFSKIENKNREHHFIVSECYLYGWGTNVDLQKAFEHCQVAAEQGYEDAKMKLVTEYQQLGFNSSKKTTRPLKKTY